MKVSVVVPIQPCAVALAIGSGRALAQTATPRAASLALDRFSPGEAGSTWFALDVLDLRGRGRWDASVVVEDADVRLFGSHTGPVVTETDSFGNTNVVNIVVGNGVGLSLHTSTVPPRGTVQGVTSSS